MGFRCQKCNKVSKPYENQNTIIVEKRDRIYHYYVVKIRGDYSKDKEIITEIKPDKNDKNKKIIKDFTRKGWEIVKLLKVCEQCAKNDQKRR